MVLNKKGIIEQFNLVIYPVDFVVVIGDLEEEVNELYIPFEEEYNSIGGPRTTGCTYRVKEKKTQTPCILIWIKNKDEFTSSIVAHECTHAALEIWSYIGSGVCLENQEPFAYLLGNLVRLAVGCFYEIPGVQSPKVKHDAFVDPNKPETEEAMPVAKRKRGRPLGSKNKKGKNKKKRAVKNLTIEKV